jgi:TPR repeat protein
MKGRTVIIVSAGGAAILVAIGIALLSGRKLTLTLPAARQDAAMRTPVGAPREAAAALADRRPAVTGLRERPPAEVTARHSRRSAFAWILRQLGANEQILDRLAAGDVVTVLTELKAQAQRGDPTAINVLGEIAVQRCRGRSNEVLDEYQASQLTNAQALPAPDREWFIAAAREDIAFDKQLNAACQQVIDQDQVYSWIAARAAQGDGASLWLMSLSADNITALQQRMRDAAAAGFPEAQFELAWAIIGGQQGAAGMGADAVNPGQLLRESADQLPRSEAELAVCEYSGCTGITADVASAITHAREAAQRGAIDAMIAIGPHLSQSQIDPDEVAAWRLVEASLEQQGCAGSASFAAVRSSRGVGLESRNREWREPCESLDYWPSWALSAPPVCYPAAQPLPRYRRRLRHPESQCSTMHSAGMRR